MGIREARQSSSSVSFSVGNAGLLGIDGLFVELPTLPAEPPPAERLGEAGGVRVWKASSHCSREERSRVSNSMTVPESHLPATIKRPRQSPGMTLQWRMLMYTGLLV